MGSCKEWLGLECVILAQAQPSLLPQCQGGASTSQLKRGTGLLAMARRPWRVLQAICQPAQPTAPASHAPDGRALVLLITLRTMLRARILHGPWMVQGKNHGYCTDGKTKQPLL